MNTLEVKKDNKTIQILENQQKDIEKAIETIKTFLNDIKYKDIEELYSTYTNQDKQVKELDKKISELEQEIKQVEERKNQLQKAIIQKESIEKQLNDFVITIAEKQEERKK